MQLVELARRPDPETLLVQIRERKHRLGTNLSADKIIEHLAAERR